MTQNETERLFLSRVAAHAGIIRKVAASYSRTAADSKRWREAETAPLDDHVLETIGDDDDLSEREHGVRQLQAFIAELDELHRALMLLYLDQHTYREIADILGIAQLAKSLDDGAVGRSVGKAQRFLDEVAAFAREA